jgi:hypothetical protein
MAVAAQLYRQGRSAERHPLAVDATLRDSTSAPLDVVVENLSRGGFRVMTGADLAIGDEVGLGLAGIGRHAARIIWRGTGSYGGEFLTPLDADDLNTALSMPSSEPVALPAPRPVAAPRIGLGPRERFFVIVGAAVATWLMLIGLGWTIARIIGLL